MISAKTLLLLKHYYRRQGSEPRLSALRDVPYLPSDAQKIAILRPLSLKMAVSSGETCISQKVQNRGSLMSVPASGPQGRRLLEKGSLSQRSMLGDSREFRDSIVSKSHD